MKFESQLYKAHIMKIVKVATLLLILLAVEIVMGVTLYSKTASVAFDGLMSGYAEEIKVVSADLDGKINAGKALTPEYTGSLSASGSGNKITINGTEYTAKDNISRNIRNHAVNVYKLEDVCVSADAFISSDEKPYFIYGEAQNDGSVALKFKSAESVMTGLTPEKFDVLALISESRRVIYAQDSASDATFADLLSYKTDLSEKTATQTVKAGDKTYALAVLPLGSAAVYVGGYSDFTEDQAKLDGLKKQAIISLVVIGATTVLLVFVSAYFTGGAISGEGKGKSYRFATDTEGRIIRADKAFEEDFPDARVIHERLNRFDENNLYAIKLPQNGEEKILTCTVDKRFSGKVFLTARELTLPFGTEIETERKDTMSSVYESFAETPQVLVGEIFLDNIQEIKNIFGREFAEDVRNILLDRIRKQFQYVFQFDYYNLGVIQPDGKLLQIMLRDLKRIVSDFNHVVKVGYDNVLVSVKCGFVLSDTAMSSRNYDYIMSAADAALKRAVEDRGDSLNRNDYFIFRESQKKLYAKYLFKIDIPQMLENGDFYLEYQPQYSLTENRIVGFEALFRVNRRVQISVSTYEIITYAEQSGNMVLLGDFIFNTGMRFAKSIEGLGVSISLNVSLVQLMQTGFVDNFLKIYRSYNLKPGAISVEITESYLMSAVDDTLKKLEILRSNGISIHLDDFGTKYSSFNYLKQLPIGAIKIDQIFIRDIDRNDYSRFITKMIVDISKNLNLSSICEGVETKQQMETVKALGCDIIQGFLISRSVDEDKARKMIAEYHYDGKTAIDTVTEETSDGESVSVEEQASEGEQTQE
ncbi:MAG: EAL domain-containing protein [Clostridia bacterium]|nr:EAL domain-containing protein [Clostridia bacterium]